MVGPIAESTSHELEVDQPGPIIVVCPQPKAAVPAKQLYFYHKPQPKKNQDMPKIGFVWKVNLRPNLMVQNFMFPILSKMKHLRVY